MAISSSGPIAMSTINSEVGSVNSNSLTTLSTNAIAYNNGQGNGTTNSPYQMKEFLGYTHTVPFLNNGVTESTFNWRTHDYNNVTTPGTYGPASYNQNSSLTYYPSTNNNGGEGNRVAARKVSGEATYTPNQHPVTAGWDIYLNGWVVASGKYRISLFFAPASTGSAAGFLTYAYPTHNTARRIYTGGTTSSSGVLTDMAGNSSQDNVRQLAMWEFDWSGSGQSDMTPDYFTYHHTVTQVRAGDYNSTNFNSTTAWNSAHSGHYNFNVGISRSDTSETFTFTDPNANPNYFGTNGPTYSPVGNGIGWLHTINLDQSPDDESIMRIRDHIYFTFGHYSNSKGVFPFVTEKFNLDSYWNWFTDGD